MVIRGAGPVAKFARDVSGAVVFVLGLVLTGAVAADAGDHLSGRWGISPGFGLSGELLGGGHRGCDNGGEGGHPGGVYAAGLQGDNGFGYFPYYRQPEFGGYDDTAIRVRIGLLHAAENIIECCNYGDGDEGRGGWYDGLYGSDQGSYGAQERDPESDRFPSSTGFFEFTE